MCEVATEKQRGNPLPHWLQQGDIKKKRLGNVSRSKKGKRGAGMPDPLKVQKQEQQKLPQGGLLLSLGLHIGGPNWGTHHYCGTSVQHLLSKREISRIGAKGVVLTGCKFVGKLRKGTAIAGGIQRHATQEGA